MTGRHAWCPRCDEVRQARPGSACPACSARLVGLPHLSGPAPWWGRPAALLQQARPLLPALRAVAAGAVLLALLAGAFVAGRGSSPAGAAPAAPASTTPSTLTLPGGRQLSGSIRTFGWRAQQGQVSLLLRSMFTTGDTTGVTFEALGLDSEWSVETVGDLRVLDNQGREVALTRVDQDLPVLRSRESARGVTMVTVLLQHRIDPSSVVRVSVGRLVLMQEFDERLAGILVDKDLKRRIDDQQGQSRPPTSPASCPSCRLQVGCDTCRTVRVAGTTYRHGQVALLLASTGRAAGESLAGADVIVSGPGGQIGSLDTTLDGGDTVVTFDGQELAATTEFGQTSMRFDVTATLSRARVVQGPWEIDQRSGSR
jgi:hypothetical protein